jgi:putative two-component system response regulator
MPCWRVARSRQLDSNSKERKLRHDLLTPMNHIIGYSEMLVEEWDAGDNASVIALRDDGRRLLDLIHALFDEDGKMIGDDGALAQVRVITATLSRQVATALAGLAASQHEQAAQDLHRITTATAALCAHLDGITAVDAPAPTPAPVTAAPLPIDTESLPPAGPVLVVDDNEYNRDMLARRMARLGYQVSVACDGLEALEALEKTSFDLVLLDVMMPRLDGVGVLRRMKARPQWQDIPVIMISALQEIDSIAHCIEMGAEDYLPKPFDPHILKARVAACFEKKRMRKQEKSYLDQIEQYAIHLEKMVREKVHAVSQAQFSMIYALSNLAAGRDAGSSGHLSRVQHYCRVLATAMMGMPRFGSVDDSYIEMLVAACPLHDIGNVGLPDEVLQKMGKLDPAEYDRLKDHTTMGANTLLAVSEQHQDNAFLRMAVEIVECHHERWDGTGYPYGLPGEAIPLAARIMAVADAYDALRSERSYKEALTHQHARDIIEAARGTHFDPDIVDCFIRTEAQFAAIWSHSGGK